MCTIPYPGLIKVRWWIFLILCSSLQKLSNSKIYLSAKNVDSNSFAADWSFRMSINTARFLFKWAVNLLILIDSTYLYERQGYILSKDQIFTFYNKCLHHKIFLKYYRFQYTIMSNKKQVKFLFSFYSLYLCGSYHYQLELTYLYYMRS